MRRVVFGAALAVAVACGGGEGRPDEQLDGLVASTAEPAQPIDVDKAASDPAELARAIAAPHRAVASALGSHAFRGTSKLRVTETGDEVEAIDDATAIDFRAGGEFRATLDNSREYGRHAIFAGGTLYLRPRYGKYHARAPTDDDEPLQIRDDIFATFGDYYELVSHAAEATDAGPATATGRSGRAIDVSRAATARKRVESLTQRKWRETLAVREVTGRVVLDAGTGIVLAGSLSAEVQFVRDGRTFRMTIEATHGFESIGDAPDVTAPPAEAVVDTPRRSHELDERDRLLDGIAPPAKKGRRP